MQKVHLRLGDLWAGDVIYWVTECCNSAMTLLRCR